MRPIGGSFNLTGKGWPMSVGSFEGITLLKHVPDPLRTELAQRLRVKQAHKGQSLVERRSSPTEVFFLLEGQAEVTLYSSDGNEVCVHDIGPGDLFGEIAVLDGEPRSASVVASSEVKVAVMRAGDFMACIGSSPAAATWLARQLASGMRRLTEQVFELSVLNVRARVHCELLRLAGKGERHEGGIEVYPAPTHLKLSKKIASCREAVTRELNELSNQHIISYEGRKLIIFDLTRLEQAAQR